MQVKIISNKDVFHAFNELTIRKKKFIFHVNMLNKARKILRFNV